MTTTLVLKEGRALAPIWLAAAVAVVASPRLGLGLGVFAYVAGAVALGVFSIGHEYAHRTLTSLLAQPISRSRLLLSKTIVLAVMLLLLTALAAVTLLSAHATNTASEEAAGWRLALIFLTPVLALCVAPWLTMVCRSVIAGLVFTLAVPAALWTVGQILRAIDTNFDVASGYRNVDRLAYEPALMLMIGGVAGVSVLAVVHGWRLFGSLEAFDAPRDLTPASTRPASARASISTTRGRAWFGLGRSPFAQLVHKEVQLQGLAFAVAGLYALAWLALNLAGTEQYLAGQSFAELSQMYGMFIALMVGALSTAEERSLGTSQWQILLPMAFWKQWLVKLLTIGLIALLLGLAVPVALEAALPLIVDSGRVGPRLPLYLWLPFFGASGGPALAILLVTLFCAYASTLCVGGLRGLLVALALTFGVASVHFNLLCTMFNLRLATHSYSPGSFRVRFRWDESWVTGNFAVVRTADRIFDWISAITFVGFVLGILYLAFRNSRSAEHGASMAKRQIPWIAAYAALAAVLLGGGRPVLEWWLLTH